MRIHNDTLNFVKSVYQYRICRFSSNSRKFHKFIHRIRHLSAVLLRNYSKCFLDVFCLVLEECYGFYVVLKVGIWVLFCERRNDFFCLHVTSLCRFSRRCTSLRLRMSYRPLSGIICLYSPGSYLQGQAFSCRRISLLDYNFHPCSSARGRRTSSVL